MTVLTEYNFFDQIKETSGISEMKTDVSSLIYQFRIPEYTSSFHPDFDQHGGRIAVFINETEPTQCLNIGLNICKKKW